MSTEAESVQLAPDASFFATLADEWTEMLVLPGDVKIPAGAHIYRRRVQDGALSCLVAGGVTVGYSMQLAHLTHPDHPGRAPTLPELLDAIDRFLPAGYAMAVILQSEGANATRPAAQPVNTVILTGISIQAAPAAAPHPGRRM